MYKINYFEYKMNYFEYIIKIIKIYDSFINIIIELNIEANDTLNTHRSKLRN
jgi:hypothetical protein